VFEWDPRKAEANAAKHGVSFDDAVTVFLDANALDGLDLQHSSAEARFRRLGQSADGRVLMVAYYPEEKRRWRNDPSHQRAARESPRARGVPREGLTSPTSPTCVVMFRQPGIVRLGGGLQLPFDSGHSEPVEP